MRAPANEDDAAEPDPDVLGREPVTKRFCLCVCEHACLSPLGSEKDKGDHLPLATGTG